MKGQMSEAELHFIRARLRGGHPVQGPPRRADHAAAHRPGLRCRRARHPRPRHRHPGRARHLFTTFEAAGSATAVRQGVPRRGLTFPWRHRKGPARARSTGSRCAPIVLHVLHNPLRRRVHLRRHREQPRPGRKPAAHSARQEWISFIPGATPDTSPGPVGGQHRQARGQRRRARRDRAAGPPAKAPAAGLISAALRRRMTIRYHPAAGRLPPTLPARRHRTPPSARIRHTLDSASASCSSTPSPRWPSRRLQVSADSEQRAAEPTRCAPPRRARRYHADLAAAATSPSTPPPARRRHPRSRLEHRLRALNDARPPTTGRDQPRALTEPKPGSQLVTDLPALERPHPARTQAHRRLLPPTSPTRTSDTITATSPGGGRPALPVTLEIGDGTIAGRLDHSPRSPSSRATAEHHHGERVCTNYQPPQRCRPVIRPDGVLGCIRLVTGM